ncbi:MAG: hypothetical protein QM784_18225 [Polyangiaceae bacterium]
MRFRTAALGLLFVACYSSGEGISPPLDRIYFPVGLAIDETKTRLYVASSDFNLQFNAGTVQALNLERIRERVLLECENDADCRDGEYCELEGEGNHLCTRNDYPGKPCGPLGEQSLAERVTVPGRCNYVALSSKGDQKSDILVDSVATGAFATDIHLTYRATRDDSGETTGMESGRLLLPIRGESSLTWIDLNEKGEMECGQSGRSQECDDGHRVGTKADENTREVTMPTEPYGLAMSDLGDAIVVTHQTTGKVSLFRQDFDLDAPDAAHDELWRKGPQLEFVQADLPLQALAVAAAPSSKTVLDARKAWIDSRSDVRFSDPYPPGFLVAYRNAARVDLLRYYSDTTSRPIRPYLQLAGTVGIAANSSGVDSRGIAFDDTERKACEAECANLGSEDLKGTCWEECAEVPLGVYVASRSPSSLLVGETMRDTWATPNRDVPRFYDSVPLPAGPSRVYVGHVLGQDGQIETRVFVVCFDQRRIAVYDPRRRAIEMFITTGRGPHAMAFDYEAADEAKGTKGRALAYVAHFTDSYVGVVELDRRKIRNYGNIVLNLGPAIAPRASK